MGRVNSYLVVFFLTSLILGYSSTAFCFYWPVYKPAPEVEKLDRATKSSINPDSINLLVWNIYKGSKKSFVNDFRRLSNSKDVVLLQEYFSSKKIERELDQSDIESVVGFSYGISMWGRTGVATLAETPSLSHELVRTDHTEEFVIGTYKAGLVTNYPINGSYKNLMVINIHFLNSVRKSQYFEELDKYSDIVNGHDGPIIFAGDFNSWRDRIDFLRTWMGRHGLKEVFFSPDKRTSFGTSPKIDHVFIKDLSVVSAQSLEVKGSDHNPLEVQLKYIN